MADNSFNYEDLAGISQSQSPPQQDSAQPVAPSGNGSFSYEELTNPSPEATSNSNKKQEEPGISGVLRRWGNSPTTVDLSDLPQSGQDLSLAGKLGTGAIAVGRGLYGAGTDAAKSVARGVVGLNDKASGVMPAESSDNPLNERETLTPDEMGVLAGVSPAMKVGLPAAGKAASNIISRVGDAAVDTAQGEGLNPVATTAPSRATDIVAKAVKADAFTPEMIEQAADALDTGLKTGKPITALDVLTKEKGGVLTQGRNLVNMTKAAATFPGDAAGFSGDVAARGASAADRIGADFDSTVSSNPFYNAKDQAATQKQLASPYYESFYTSTPSLQSPTIDRVLNTPLGQRALAAVREDAQNERIKMGTPDPDLSEQAADAGVVSPGGVAAGLKPEMLDRIKKKLDETARDNKRALDAGNTNYSTRADYYGASTLSETLRNEMDRLDPTPTGAYAQGRRFSAQGFQMDDAAEQGRAFMQQDPEDIQKWFNDPHTSEPMKAAYLSGQRRALQDIVDRKQIGANPISSFNTPAVQKRLRASLGDTAYEPLDNALALETRMAKVNGVHTGGSDTMIKNNFGEQLNQQPIGVGSGIKAALNYKQTAVDLVDKFLGDKATAGNQKIAGEVMRYMTSNDPQKLRDLAQYMRTKNPAGNARGGAIHMAKGGAVLPRPKSYPAIEAMRKRNA